MKSYMKPIVLANEELAEGVYAASGAVSEDGGSGEAGSASVSGVTVVSQGDQWNRVNTYKVTIVNSGSEELTDWSVSISITSGTATGAQIYNGWLASASMSGNKITITPGGGGSIGAGSSIDVEVVVSYSSDSITVQ